MAKFNYKNLVDNLPDIFAKDEDSVNYKLLQLHSLEKDIQRDILAQVAEAMTIGGAGECALDDIHGGRLNLPRGACEDEAYRIKLRAKAMQNIADGSFPKMIEALAYILQIDASEIKIRECPDSNNVTIEDISLVALRNAGIALGEIIPMTEKLLAVNINVGAVFHAKTPIHGIYVGGMVAKRRVQRFGAIPAEKLSTYGQVLKDYKNFDEMKQKTYADILYGD